jgi:lipopolysaccharide transport system ATP-binding protein
MSDAVIKVANISKKYNILHGKKLGEDSFFGSLLSFAGKKNATREEFFALQNISFEVKKGERLGIIGRNGAGKSTLLKILSRIVTPTTGNIEYTGRMASLLEVGTGFHSELTGRENVFLNGSILGMSKAEIASKFDEIVAFAEVEKFIDTPVKRYSSGMYVRLAFSVAAHLNPEIMIVDEVLAVGDVAFQQKCMGKMEETSSKTGKTILFVSHNMGQVSALCNTGILINKGVIEKTGTAKDIVNEYFLVNRPEEKSELVFEENNEKQYYFRSIFVQNDEGERNTVFAHDGNIVFNIEVNCNTEINDVLLSLMFYDNSEKRIFTSQKLISGIVKKGNTKMFKITVPKNTLTPNIYRFSVAIHIPNVQVIDEVKNAGILTIFDNGSEYYMYNGVDFGYVFVNCKWEY